jgi:hypothetical protein
MRTLALALLLVPTLASAAPCTPRNFSYAYSTRAGTISLSGSANLEQFIHAQKRFAGADFLWTRLKGREYLIRDAQTLDRVRALFAPLRALEPEMDRINDEEGDLDEQVDAIHDGPEAKRDEARLQKLEQRLEVIRRRQRELERMEAEIECAAEKKLIPLIEEAIREGRAKRV